ncbi:hypothetical protein FACS189418_7410 [Clostridia bacterium]|nr:hypothetical protein FACS189418_7410 [Clostridia bacterium]
MINTVLEFSLYFGTIYGSYRYGLGQGSAIAMLLGLCETVHLQHISPLGIFSVIGILSASFRTLGKLASITAVFAGVFVIGILYAPEFLSMMFPYLCLASLGFLFLPEIYCHPKRKKEEASKLYSGQEDQLSAQRLKEMACSLEQLSRSFQYKNQDEQKISMQEATLAFQTACVLVCRDCKACNMYCAPYTAQSQQILSLVQTFESQGVILREDMPKLFEQMCDRKEMYLDQINYSLGKAKNNLVWKNRFLESRDVVANQFLELSTIMENFSKKIESVSDITPKFEKQLRKILVKKRIKVKNLTILEQENKRKEIYFFASCLYGNCVTVKELAEMFGKEMHCHFKSGRDSKNVIHKEFGKIHIIEDTKYMVLHGMAKAVKDNGEISGDNFSYCKLPDGKALIGLSDGMGSGKEAYQDSEHVIELTEQLLETGFSMEAAAKMVHSVLLMQTKEQKPTTLDLICMDLYTGMFEEIKFGASASYIIHLEQGYSVEMIESESLPIGILPEIEPKKIQKPLSEGDIVLMVTDGVIEAFPGTNKEESMRKYLSGLRCNNPSDLAKQILAYACESDGEPKDDMLVLATGIWEKE